MIELVLNKFKELINRLDKYGHGAVKFLNKGLEPDEIESIINKNEIKLPDILVQHFIACNGLQKCDLTIGEALLFNTGIPFGLEEAIRQFNYSKMEDYYPESLFPIFHDGGGEELLFQLGPEEDFGFIYYMSSSNVYFDTLITYCDSYELLLESVIECYERGAYKIENEILIIDYKLRSKIFEELNPKSEYWKI